ncbi:GNAT family N-acetyltransferase [Sinorhizobium meliloti]|uniref:GNAT family N-acetyltransferase n=1 Tax=Rhizobium meliloti TaxID=382 RepID=UPI001F16D0DB|nr:GNAT family N-acetyltransferase [Sinorhizobium meliloti]
MLPEHRRKGIYTALFYALRDKAQEQGNIFSILSGTHPNNLAAQAAFEAQGRRKEYIMYSYPTRRRPRDMLSTRQCRKAHTGRY